MADEYLNDDDETIPYLSYVDGEFKSEPTRSLQDEINFLKNEVKFLRDKLEVFEIQNAFVTIKTNEINKF